jgi:hypothetical protein
MTLWVLLQSIKVVKAGQPSRVAVCRIRFNYGFMDKQIPFNYDLDLL